MINIREYINNHLIDPLKYNSTILQDSIIEVIIQRLEELYGYVVKFPEIVSPSESRMDILKIIADQFLFDIRTDAELKEQIDILERILYVYNRRGSVDSIENMWKYYGGKLPRDVKISIPSANLFRYSRSKLSGTHVFQDGDTNRSGVYEVKLTNNTYPVEDLKEFMLKELVAAGTRIYFTNSVYSEINSEDPSTNPYKYDINLIDYKHNLELLVLYSRSGYTWSGRHGLGTEKAVWSGNPVIFIDINHVLDLDMSSSKIVFDLIDGAIDIVRLTSPMDVLFSTIVYEFETTVLYDIYAAYSTSEGDTQYFDLDYYDRSGERVEYSNFPGYFVLGHTRLGEEVI